MRATYTVFAFGQTSLLMLVCLLTMWPRRGRPAGGVFGALAVGVKPVMAFAPGWLLMRRRWAALKGAIATGAALFAIAAVAFGPRTVLTYFTDSPATRAPHSVFEQEENQSLSATFVRLTDYDFSRGLPLTDPVVLGI